MHTAGSIPGTKFTLAAIIAAALSACAASAPVEASSDAATDGAITLASQGSFQAGGRVMGDASTGTLHCDHGFVEYQIPVNSRKVGLFMWHSSSAHVWQNRWDGGEGYQSMWLRRGYPVYLWDGPWVGRANWGCQGHEYKAELGRDQGNWTAWRFGLKAGQWFDNVQFPKDSTEAYDQAMSARYNEFDTWENPFLQSDAAAAAIDRIGPVVALTSSAGGLRAMLTATKTNNLKAIVTYETPAFVFPEGMGPKQETGIRSVEVPMEQFMALTRIPIQVVWGDNTEGTFWAESVALSRKFADIVNANGGNAEVFMLPSAGLRGNTHIPFADMNNAEVAAQLELFLAKNGLDQR